jgi:outer membrane protein assembly factor BamA
LDIAAIVTTRSQKRFVISPDIYFLGGLLNWEPSLQYKEWPGYYWRGGNSPEDSSYSYDMDLWQFKGKLSISPQRAPKLNLGAEYDLEWNCTNFNDSLLNQGMRKGGNRVGLGYVLGWDARDHDNWPRRGYFVEWRQLLFREEWGSDYNFQVMKLDARLFLPTPLEGAWGFATYWEGVRGAVPFDRMSMPDGVYHLRGLEKGRLSDKQQLILQGEWRVPLFWRFSLASFAEAGKVGPYASELARNDFHYAFGMGGRLALNPKRRVNVRGDLSWVDGGIGMTIYYKEAF